MATPARSLDRRSLDSGFDQQFIAGRWRSGRASHSNHDVSPWNGDLLTEILPRVRNLVRYLVRGDEDVDDIAQDALVAVMEDLRGYRGEGRFESWVDRIVARLMDQYARKESDRSRSHSKPDGGMKKI